MPVFQYNAYDSAGKEVSGEIEAVSNREAIQRLRKDGLYPKNVSSAAGAMKHGILYRLRRRVTLDELAAAIGQLATLLNSGTPLYDALAVLSSEEENRVLRDIFMRLKERIAEGSSLSSAMEDHPDVFAEIYCRMVEAGEVSGALDKVLGRLAEYLESMARVQTRVRSALIYPALMTVVGFGVLSFLFIFVIPKIVRIFEDTKQALPLITVTLLWIVNLFKNYWFLIAAAAAVIAWGIKRFIATEKGKIMADNIAVKFPIAGELFRKYYIATFARTLGSLLESGVPILKALDMTRKILNHSLFEIILRKAATDVTEGSALSASLKGSGIIPGLLTHMVSIGEKSGKLDDMLLTAARSYEKDFETAVARALTLLEPILILAMGIIVGFIVLAILLPIFELNQVVH